MGLGEQVMLVEGCECVNVPGRRAVCHGQTVNTLWQRLQVLDSDASLGGD